jgi:hypothetical protein
MKETDHPDIGKLLIIHKGISPKDMLGVYIIVAFRNGCYVVDRSTYTVEHSDSKVISPLSYFFRNCCKVVG